MTEAALSGFEGQDIRTLIDARAAERGDQPWLTWAPFDGPPRRWTYSEFQETVRRFAAGLHARGVRPGERVIVHLTNSAESVIAWLGCAYAGAVAVTTNAGSTRDELAYYAEHSRAVAAITQPDFAELVAAAAPQLSWLAVTGEGSPGTSPFGEIDGDHLPERPHDPMAPFGIQYTSGTTARPKAVLWTHANALWGARLSAMHEGLLPDDVHLVHLPLFHTNAQVYSVLAALWAGAAIVVQPRFSASRFWPVSLEHGCTVTSVVPFCVRALSDQPDPAEHSYRLWGNAFADPRIEARYGVKTLGWWGMTETITHGIVGSAYGQNAPMAMGRPSPGYQILVLDDEGQPVGPGEVGNLFVRGRRGVSLFLEYADNPQATEAAYPEPDLLATGDRVLLGPDGSLYFSDRDKDMLKVGGENVAASEVERVIAQVAGVVEVAVVGRADPMLDEVPVAFVIATDPGDALQARILAACVEGLAPFKRPRELRFVASLPRSTLEKIAKAELRALLREPADA
jgi:crotonobetaine/carnitine-CoA ligase